MTGESVEEIVIVGGGLAGASAACLLGRAGCRALLIERDSDPRHKVCGEFLSIEAQTYLAHLGIDLDDLGASRISRLRLIQGRKTAEVDLPFLARGLSRKVLDEALLQQASLSGARILRGTTIRTVASIGPHIRIETGSAGSLHADTVFLATGKHDVRSVKRPAAGAMDDLIGFKAHYGVTNAQRKMLDGVVEVVLFSGGYAGLQLVERNMANLCLVVSQECFQQVGKSWDNLIRHVTRECPPLADRLQGANAVFDRPLSIFQIPYGFIHVPEEGEPQGLFRLGDQVGVIPSFTGEGMSMALHSGCLAASTFLQHGRASSIFHRRMREDIRHQVRFASALNRAARHFLGQKTIFHVCSLWPAVMQQVAALTRMREFAVKRALVVP
jgi:flavin-dependent dehydrogenase